MKKTIVIYIISLVGMIVFLTACNRDVFDTTARQDDFSSSARVQVYNVSVGSQRNFVYLDGKALTGVALAYTNTSFLPLFPATANSFAIPTGLRNFSVRDTLVTSIQPQLAFSENFEGGKHYTVFIYDTMSATKQKTVETNIVVPGDNTARVRFANFAWLKAGVPPAVDVFSKRQNANVFTNIPYTGVTDFISYESGVADSLIVRATGTATGLDTAVLTFAAKRNYTTVFRGRYAFNESGGATFPRTLSSFINY